MENECCGFKAKQIEFSLNHAQYRNTFTMNEKLTFLSAMKTLSNFCFTFSNTGHNTRLQPTLLWSVTQ